MFDWRELLQQASELVRDHLLKALIGPLLVAVGGAWAWWIARRQMRRRAFMRRVNASLNIVEPIEGAQPHAFRLKLRTIFEMNIEDILLGNNAAVRLVLDASKHTDAKHPFLAFTDADDQWLILNAVLNELSERFSAGMIAQAAGATTRKQTFLFGVTCEKGGDVRIQKVRIMLISEPMLRLVHEWSRIASDAPRPEPVYESPNHAVRWQTLQAMARLLFEQQSKAIMRMELIVPA